uniref:neurofilament medium polypeptide-like n=1 Tax=Scatophagus argus TaxID=75038 RepID=UPI001ED811FD|nr:neurofilament medium polypeptide-like [Scatophagus argus]
MVEHEVTESIEEDSPQESEKDETEREVVGNLDQTLEITEDQKSERIPQAVQLEQEDGILEVVDRLQTLRAVLVSSVNEEAINVQVLENAVSYDETSAPYADNAAVTEESKHEVLLSAAQVSVECERESELPGTEIETTQAEHVSAAQAITCDLKDVSVAIPAVFIEKTSEMTEPLISTKVSEEVFKEEVEAATPLVTEYVAETAEEGSSVVMMHLPSVMFVDNHSIQVQVVDVTITSAETIVDSVLEVGQTEAKEVIDVCPETIKEVDNVSATPGTEEELTEENKVTIQEVIQHVKEKLPETLPEPVNLEQEVIKQPDAVAKMSETVESESNEEEDQKETEDSIGAFRERKDEVPAEITDDISTEKQVSLELMQTPDIPGSLDVSIHDHEEDLEETKPEKEKSEKGITAEVVKLPSEELEVEKIPEQAQISQTAPSAIVPTSNTGLVVPQNTGIISSTGNVESPSSLSLEFKLNIQFGQGRAPASLPPTTERTAPVKQKDMSEVGVQVAEAEEPAKPMSPTPTAESQKQTELSEAEVTTNKPVLLNVAIQAMETAEPVEQFKPTDTATSSVQATGTIQPVRPTEKGELFLSPPVHPEARDQETKEKEPVNQTEEENDQDVWMDAEEVIYTQEETEVSLLQAEDNPEPQTASEQDEKAGLEAEKAPISKSEEEERQQEMCKTGGTCQIESEDEDFAVALEHPETVSVTTLE